MFREDIVYKVRRISSPTLTRPLRLRNIRRTSGGIVVRGCSHCSATIPSLACVQTPAVARGMHNLPLYLQVMLGSTSRPRNRKRDAVIVAALRRGHCRKLQRRRGNVSRTLQCSSLGRLDANLLQSFSPYIRAPFCCQPRPN